MANVRAITRDATGYGTQEIANADVLLVGNITPSAGNLTLGGFTGSNVIITGGQTLGISGATGGLNLTGGADLSAAAGSTLSGFDSIEGITSGNLVDKSAAETITGQWTFQSGDAVNPKLIVKANGGEAANSLLFQVQTSLGANLFSVDIDGDVVVAGGETVAGTTIYTGDVTLGDGGNTIKVGGTPLAPLAVGDIVIISTMGGVGGTDSAFSISSPNYNVDTSGNVDQAGDQTFTGGGTINTTANGNLTLSPNGTGVVDITTDILLTGNDIGTALLPMGDLYATNIYGPLAGDGTNSVVWVANLDAALATDEDTMIVTAGGDGTAVQAWRWFNDTTAKDFLLQYKQNPTSLISTAEAYTLTALTAHSTGTVDFGYNVNAQAGLDVTGAALTVDANGIDTLGGIDLNGTLSFDGVAASAINTSGNNPLTLSVGTSSVTVTAGLVDLRTSVTLLDIPAGSASALTGLSIGGTKITTPAFTAANMDILLQGGSNADALHTHAAVDAGQVVVAGLVTTGLTAGYGTYISTANTPAHSICKPIGSSFQSATFAGVVDVIHATNGTLVVAGTIKGVFEAGLGAAMFAGAPVLLSMLAGGTSGKFTTTSATAAAGAFITRVGTVVEFATYGVDSMATILLQPQSPVSI